MCVHVLMHVCASRDAWGVCLVCAWHGIEAQNGQSVKNTHKLIKTWFIWSNKTKTKDWNSVESKITQKCHLDNLSNIWHATMQNIYGKCMNIWKNASIHAQTATRGQHRCTNIKWNGTQPNQRIEKNFTKFRIPTQFSKIPNFQSLKHRFCIIRK